MKFEKKGPLNRLDVFDAIKNRHSCRAFIDKPVNKEIVYSILDIARFAPSGVNTQPWKIVVLTGSLKLQISKAIIAAREAGIPEDPDYHYYPTSWREPYKSRRKACGLALYSAINIQIDEKEKRKEAWYRNYHFFGAPIGLLFFLDSDLEKGSWVDMGMFIQNVMLAAHGFNLETCPQAALAEYPNIVRNLLKISNDKSLLCGMALGYPDNNHPINQYRTVREPVESFTQFIDD